MQLREWRMAQRLGLADAPPLPRVAMMVELRPDPALFRTIAVLHKNLLPPEGWPIQIFHGAHNKQVSRFGGPCLFPWQRCTSLKTCACCLWVIIRQCPAD